jgi:cytochrome c biogenesis protein CcmG/thiol:disulfide interchange protein DsbE
MRRALPYLAVAVLIAVLVIGLTQASKPGGNNDDGTHFDLPAAKAKLAAAPAPLNGLYAQASEILDGGRSAFDARLAQLKGHPIVINKWASWCVPCQSEFAIFQSVAVTRGAQVGFLGLDSNDATPRAKKFLAKRPLPFPSYADPKQDIADSIEAPQNSPITVFLDRTGKMAFIHSGQYRSVADLNADIDRYFH